MSSNRAVPPCDAYLERNDHPAGPLRLPQQNKNSFIAEFNRKYDSVGLLLQPIKKPETDDQTKPVKGPSPQ
jgi:hypothetical protein